MPIEVRESVIQGKMKGEANNPNSLDDDRINELECKSKIAFSTIKK